jgi:hypothetical protein
MSKSLRRGAIFLRWNKLNWFINYFNDLHKHIKIQTRPEELAQIMLINPSEMKISKRR